MDAAFNSMMVPLEILKPGDRVWFEGERQGYTVQARWDKFIVCTKPFNLKRTVFYTIVDTEKLIRGTENLVFGMGAETNLQCRQMIRRLRSGRTEISCRNRVGLKITKALSRQNPRQPESQSGS